MFNTQKNKLYNLIEEAGLEASEFSKNEGPANFELKFRSSPFSFQISINEANLVTASATKFIPGFPTHTVLNHGTYEQLEGTFTSWLKKDIKNYLIELDTPDLWSQAARETPLVRENMFSNADTEEFSEEEKTQIRLSLSEFKRLVVEEFTPTEVQLGLINERIEYLSKGLDRLNKFDWKSILISSVISIATNLTVDTERGILLWKMLAKAFRHILQLGD